MAIGDGSGGLTPPAVGFRFSKDDPGPAAQPPRPAGRPRRRSGRPRTQAVAGSASARYRCAMVEPRPRRRVHYARSQAGQRRASFAGLQLDHRSPRTVATSAAEHWATPPTRRARAVADEGAG
ncbi:hypothetical protein HBB16_04275 [Pseudonocardia sp. MCCB 268]|nr:hypothetical protein [Pseudonocardia cytotoxica]